MQTGTRHIARTDGVVVQEMGDELLLYDERTDVAHCLTSVAAEVWRVCREGATVAELTEAVHTDGDAEAVVLGALRELSDNDLLIAGVGPVGMSRREVLGRMAKIGATAAVAAPLIVSARVPDADAAGSPGTCRQIGQSCTPASTKNSQNNCCGTATCNEQAICSTCTPAGGNPGGACKNGFAYACCSGVCSSTDNTKCG